MHTLVLVNINLHTKFEFPSFTRSDDTVEPQDFYNGLCDPDHAHFRVVCLIWPIYKQNLKNLASAFSEIWRKTQSLK